jgi:branched-chain amino acid aminotransferase
MSATINVNGRITGERDGAISVLDHGFLYGEGVYEVLRVYAGRPWLFDRHLARMRDSAAMLNLPLPFSDAEIERRMRETIEAFHGEPENHGVADVYVRILLTRGVGPLSYDPRACTTPSLVIIVMPVKALAPAVYENGVTVSLVSVVRNHPGSLNPRIKSNNLLNQALAAQEAFGKGGFDAVMRNYRGEISECSIANLFIVKDGTVLTPPDDAGLLLGITRGFVLDLGRAMGIPMREAVLHDADLFAANEAFLTSSTQEIVPIVRIDDRVIGSGRPGPTTKRLHEAYRERVREMAAPRNA